MIRFISQDQFDLLRSCRPAAIIFGTKIDDCTVRFFIRGTEYNIINAVKQLILTRTADRYR